VSLDCGQYCVVRGRALQCLTIATVTLTDFCFRQFLSPLFSLPSSQLRVRRPKDTHTRDLRDGQADDWMVC
jgi:hypothetical protein